MSPATLPALVPGVRFKPQSLHVTALMLQQFGMLIGDDNPVHLDDDYARQRGFPGAIAHGAIAASVVLRMLEVQLQGWPRVGDEIELTYVAPVTTGAVLTAHGVCNSVDADAYLADVWCMDADEQKVLGGKVRIMKLRGGHA